MRMVLEQPAPGSPQQILRPGGRDGPGQPREGDQRLGVAFQQRLHPVVALLEGDAGGVDALQDFGIAAPAEFPAEFGQAGAGLAHIAQIVAQRAQVEVHIGEGRPGAPDQLRDARLGLGVIDAVHQQAGGGVAHAFQLFQRLPDLLQSHLPVKGQL